MKRSIRSMLLIFCFIGITALNCAAQFNTDSSSICFYNCTGVSSELLKECFKTDIDDVTRLPDDVNPYKLFDSIVRTIQKEAGSNKFNLHYTFKACDIVCNAAAMLGKDGEQIILYSPLFMNDIKAAQAKKRWALICIFAHEIGHQAMDHTSKASIKDEDSRRFETRADFFAGMMLSKFPGVTLQDAYEGLRTLDSLHYQPATDEIEKTSRYPTWDHRKRAIKGGFEHQITSPEGIAVFKDIKAYAGRKGGLNYLFRTTDEAFKSGQLAEVEKIILDFAKENNIDLDELAKSNSLVRKLKHEIKSKTDVKPVIKTTDGNMNIIFNDEQLQELKKKSSELKKDRQ